MSDSSSTTSVVIVSQIFRNSILNFSINAGICCFLAVLFLPLYRFALNGRYALLIVLSKAIGTFLLSAYWSIKNGSDLSMIGDGNFLKLAEHAMEPLIVSERVHILCLAINRAHSVYFPFHYSRVMNKKSILIYCALCWAISIVLGVLHTFLNIVEPPSAVNNFFNTASWIYLIVNQTSVYGSFGLYSAIIAKMVWRKSFRTWNAGNFEKDITKICMLCSISLTPFLLNILFTLLGAFSFQPIPLNFARLLVEFLANSVGYCAEEIGLLIAHGDFQKELKKFIFGRFCQTNLVQNETINRSETVGTPLFLVTKRAMQVRNDETKL